MKREIMTTGDGSKTIHIPDLNEQYHSKHGALQEARHVFIKTGLDFYRTAAEPTASMVRILEYGFGTGLNALLTALQDNDLVIEYTGTEAFPITKEEIEAMDYGSLLDAKELYNKLHDAQWETATLITEKFQLTKKQLNFEEIYYEAAFELIYFDAFGPRTQPELWTLEIFESAYKALSSNGVLVTYCAAGQVRRNLQQAGFVVERLPGPPGKREMLRARKPRLF
jgi:tRNA U34 5-methylaminomethyl-2-thiouridine-forming methyltransferase MnmC